MFELFCWNLQIRRNPDYESSKHISEILFVQTLELLLKQKFILNFTAVSLFMVFSTVAGVTNPIQVNKTPSVEDVQVVDNSSKKEVINQKMSIEQYVRDYFSDLPIMTHIAYCESRFRQYDKDGSVFRGAVNNQDVGVMQINERYHLDTAEQGNYDIYSIEGNMAYGRKLYEKFGTDPWNSSKACWGKYVSGGQVASDNSIQLAQK